MNWLRSSLSRTRSAAPSITAAPSLDLRILANKAMLSEHAVSGPTSMQALANLMPPPKKLHWRFAISVYEWPCQVRYTLDRVTVSISIGRSRRWWLPRSGSATPMGLNDYYIVEVLRLIRLELRIYLRYFVLPEPIIGKTESSWSGQENL